MGLTALGITDHGCVSGHIQHKNACKKAGIKPILGCELYVVHQPAYIKNKDNRHNSHMVVWAKNKQGWKDLSKLVSKTNDADCFYYKPRISLYDSIDSDGKHREGLETYVKNGNIQGFSGHQGSLLSDFLFCDVYGNPEEENAKLKKAYGQYKNPDIEFYRKFLKPNWLESTCELALKLERLFGKGNFFIELQNELDPSDKLALWIHPLIVECLREVSKQTGIPAVASSDPHYPSKADSCDQRATVMVNMKESESSIAEKFDSEEDTNLMVFFGSDNFYIHSYEEMSEKFSKEELEMSVKIADGVEEYEISHKPYIPKLEIPNFPKNASYLKSGPTESDKYLMYLAVEGAKTLKPWKSGKSKEEYWDRLNEEFKIIFKAGLSDYFLVVWDYCMAGDNRPADHSFDWKSNTKNKGELDPIPRGVGRGSAAGCLVSYFTGITAIDPIKYDLVFSRFYNEGRNTAEHVELPDIDVDFSVENRDWIIEYIANKYGQNNVAQMVTFQRMQGRAAIKDIFRIKNIEGGFELSNDICKYIPNEAEIADEIQELRDSGEENYGILRWALDNSINIQDFYNRPELKPVFDQAIRCEGVKRGQGRHPSGVIVVPFPVDECFPMILDTKTKTKIVGVDMNDAAQLGATKLDILGVAGLTKLKMSQDLINGKVFKRNKTKEHREDNE